MTSSCCFLKIDQNSICNLHQNRQQKAKFKAGKTPLAITFIRAEYLNYAPARGACAIVAYTARKALIDRIARQRHDFRRHAGDLVFSAVIGPGGADIAVSPDEFANAVDRAEDQKFRNRGERERRPQVLGSLIVALPPDDEITIDEAARIVRAIVGRVIEDRDLCAFVAIHDPRRKDARSRNRHAHILVALREGVLNDPRGNKVRDLFARVRTNTGPHGSFPAVVEGMTWPDLSRDIQTRLFAECGLSTFVDPIAPVPEQFLVLDRRDAKASNTAISCQRSRRKIASCEIIRGDPLEFVEAQLRNRSIMPLAEVRAVVDRFIDADNERRAIVNGIIADERIVALAEPGGPISRVTTRAVYDDLDCASALVREAIKNGNPRIVVRYGLDAEPIYRSLTESLAASAIREILIVGAKRSHCEQLQARVGARAVVQVASAILVDKSSLSSPALISIPHLEKIADAELARLIVAANRAGCEIVAGFHIPTADGVANHRFASWIASQLGQATEDNLDAGALLGAGLIGSALQKLFGAEILRFETPPALREKGVIVVDDLLINKGTHTHLSKFQTGQRIVVEQTDYTKEPPVNRKGRIGIVTRSGDDSNEITIAYPNGEEASIDLDRFTELRAADIVTLREGKQAPPDVGLEIHVNSIGRAYGLIALATKHAGDAVAWIAADFARDLNHLTEAVERSLPGALPFEFEPRRDLKAEAETELHAWVASALPQPIDNLRLELSDFPVPSFKKSAPEPVRAILSKRVRAALAADHFAREGLGNLYHALSPDATDREHVGAHILSKLSSSSLACRLVNALLKDASCGPGRRKIFGQDFDFPATMEELCEDVDPTDIELWNLMQTLSLMAFSYSGFNIARPIRRSVAQIVVSPSEGITEEKPFGLLEDFLKP